MSFEHASVTKGLMVGLGLTTILAGLFDVKHYLHLQFVPHISRHHQYWRLAVHDLAFSNSSDLFVAELILYHVGIHIERQFGSVKFASFAFVSTLLTTLLEFLFLILFHRVGLNYIAMGPSALLFSILYQYSRIVPSVYSYRIFGIPLNNKSLLYLLALQMALSRMPGSAAVALIGIITGQMYRSDLANLNTYRLPLSLVQFSTRFILPLIGPSKAPRRSNRALPDITRNAQRTNNLSSQNDEIITTARTPSAPRNDNLDNDGNRPEPSVVREWVDGLTGRAVLAPGGVRVPTEAEIIQVTTMFPSLDRAVVLGALQRSPNIEGAVETLLLVQ